MTSAFISLGSNLGERGQNISRALQELAALQKTKLLTTSLNYETDPEGNTEQGKFINAVAKIETGLSPRELLLELQETEKRLGRTPAPKWGPRLIDLDILTYGDEIIDSPDLSIPHPLLTKRFFVLKPLCEIAPAEIHPLLKKTFLEIFESFKE